MLIKKNKIPEIACRVAASSNKVFEQGFCSGAQKAAPAEKRRSANPDGGS